MSAVRCGKRNAAIVAAAISMWLASAASAGPIAAGSLPGGPPLLGTIEAGTPVDASNLIINQYQSVGLSASVFKNLSLSALANVGGVTAFVPTVLTGSTFNLDYSGFVGFQIVDPTSGANAMTHHLSVEFVGPHADQGFLYAMTSQGGILGSTAADDGVGPHGGRLATLDVDGIGMFAAWSLFDGAGDTRIQANNMWGLATIDINGDAPAPGSGGGDVERTPEPATLALSGIGILSAAGAAWRRRRSDASR